MRASAWSDGLFAGTLPSSHHDCGFAHPGRTMISQAPAEVQASIHYLVPTSRVNRRFWAPGAELNTGVYAPYPVTIRNARLADEVIALDTHGFCLATHRT